MGYNPNILHLYVGYNPLILTIDPNFLGHPSGGFKHAFFLHLTTWEIIDTIPKTNSSPLKIGRNPRGNEKVFQPSIFRGENVSFREGN